jgi:hypothetical protein
LWGELVVGILSSTFAHLTMQQENEPIEIDFKPNKKMDTVVKSALSCS